MSKAMVVLSGGQDSATCLFWAKTQFDEVHAVSFDYAQRHQIELIAARKCALLAGVASHEVASIGPILSGMSPLTNPETALEQYPDYESMTKTIGDRVELTFVPMRNALFLTLAANRAVVRGINHLVTGVCQADGANYPDCRMSFIQAQTRTISEALGSEFFIHTPLIDLKKSESVHLALSLPGCYQALAYTHTGYDGAYPPTGHDHASLLRAHGFEEANVADPLVLRALFEGKMEKPDTLNYAQWMPRAYYAECNFNKEDIFNKLLNIEVSYQKKTS